MEQRRRLTDLLAVTAGELLPHRRDHLPLPRDHFQRLRHILTELAQAVAAPAGASCRRFDDDPLARQMHREGLARGGALAHKSLDRRRFRHGPFRRKLVLGRVGFQLFERQRQLVDQTRRAFRSLAVNLTLELGDPKLLLCDQCTVLRRLRMGNREFRSAISRPFARSVASAAFKAATSSGSASRSASM